MEVYNLSYPQEQVSLSQAIKQGLGKEKGLFFPTEIKPLANVKELLQEKNFVDRTTAIIKHLFADELSYETLHKLIKKTYHFSPILKTLESGVHSLELFHGPTLAFKDFGVGFLAQVLNHLQQDKKITILSATSGDTGAAVAQAFYDLPNVNVVVMFPKGKISAAQEKLFSTLGKNIHSLAIDADFDACQSLLKQSLADADLVTKIGLNSANSINFARIIGQIGYYFETLSQLNWQGSSPIRFSVPCGNFGNLSSGLFSALLLGEWGDKMNFSVATNANDTIPRYLKTGDWDPRPTISTIANAMDISKPSNWPRVEEFLKRLGRSQETLRCGALTDDETEAVIQKIYQQYNYLADPHTAIAYQVLMTTKENDEEGVFLSTAHPAKFYQTMEDALKISLELPPEIADANRKESQSIDFPNDIKLLKSFLQDINQ